LWLGWLCSIFRRHHAVSPYTVHIFSDVRDLLVALVSGSDVYALFYTSESGEDNEEENIAVSNRFRIARQVRLWGTGGIIL
jgi:hypothetical protein